MAVTSLLACGFEGGRASMWPERGWLFYSGASGPTMVNTAGRTHKTLALAGSAWAINPFIWCSTPVVSTSARKLAYWFCPVSHYYHTVVFSKSAGRQVMVNFNQDGSINVFRDTTLLYTAPVGTWNSNVPQWINIYLSAKNVGGVITITMNGTQVLTYTGDLVAQATEDWDQVSWGNRFGSGYNWETDSLDDVMIQDDDGGASLTPIPETWGFPVAVDGVISGNLTGVPTTGANRFQNINEVPASTAQYNLAAAINDEDLYSAAAPPTGATVQCIAVYAEAGRDGVITQAEIHVVSGASDTYGTVETLPASPSYGVIDRVLTRNPDGDVAWDAAALAALQVGLRFS